MPVVLAPDEMATDAIGAIVANHLMAGDIVTLEGDLGAGKTALARAIIRARLDDPDLEVPSPSFAIVQPYPGIIHADLYRLSDESEIDELGLLDDEAAIVLVEWPQRAPTLFNRTGLRISLGMGPDGGGRLVSIEASGRDARDLATALASWRYEGPQ